MYQQYLEDINHQVAHKKLQKQEEQKREEEEIRKIVDADRKSVEVARSKTRELKKINRDIQDQIWQDCQSKRKAENEQRNHENSKERNQTSRNVVDNDKMLKDHSQRRRVAPPDPRSLKSKWD